MHQFREKSSDSYNLNNCFGFDEDDLDLSVLNNSSAINGTFRSNEFQSDKPFRLALYVRPSQRRGINVNHSFLTSKNANQKIGEKKNESNSNSRLKSKSNVKKNKSGNINIMLFDENAKPDENKQGSGKSEKMNVENGSILKHITVSRKKTSVLTEINSKPITKTKQYKTRRSYERKCKERQPETIQEPEKPSDEIIREIEIKKLSRTKPKKITKEEQEFEKWASDVNSDFNDVDKFELSIAYD